MTVFNKGDMIQCSLMPAQKAYVCRSNVLGVADSSVVCYFDGPMNSVGDKQQALFGNNCSGCWELDNSQLTGSVSTSMNSTTVTGSGTSFTSDMVVGDKIIVGMDQRVVSSITSDTSLEVTVAYTMNMSNKEIRNIGQAH